MKFVLEFVKHFLNDGGRITFLHVVVSSVLPVSPGEWRQALNAISTTHMLTATSEVDYKVRNAESIVRGVLDEAGKGGYDLILFANSTYRKHASHLFGGKIDEVIRRTPVEVVVLSYQDDMPLKYRKILIPTSGYRHALRAARLAEVLAKRHDSDVTVLYVGTNKEDPKTIFEPVAGDLKLNEVRHRMLFRHGPVIESIVDEAEKGYDLVMIGATERPAYYQYVAGSTADSLIRKLPCPVVMVKTLKSFEDS
jgi:Universal stress protein UspA and related nucleotide-binding proteins